MALTSRVFLNGSTDNTIECGRIIHRFYPCILDIIDKKSQQKYDPACIHVAADMLFKVLQRGIHVISHRI